MLFENFIEKSQCIDNIADLSALFGRAVADEGYENHILTTVQNKVVGRVAWYDFPEDYVASYFENEWSEIDPVLEHSRKAKNPFYWRDILSNCTLSSRQNSFLDQCREIGVHSGITIPLRSPKNRLEIISISRRNSDKTDRSRHKYLYSIAVQTWWRFVELSAAELSAPSALTKLTHREIECLQWCKAGKTYPEIGEILSISSKSVEFHMYNVMNKLKASNKIMAVVMAIQKEIIDID